VDMWSLACVFIELVTSKVFILANDELTACKTIFSICGSPDEKSMPGCEQYSLYKTTAEVLV
jgi:hypothetical protein